MSRSDIFDAYAKLALEKGLIKNAEESKELKRYKDDSEPRVGSDTKEVIENLYGVKPKGQEYKNNIMEIAHPEKVILAPSYDKLNGLVENNIERQNIIINITQKPVNGHLTQHKYALEDLALSLTKVANDMDNRDIEEIRVLADTCLEQLHKEALDFKDITNFFKDKGGDVVDVAEGAGVGGIAGGIVGGLIGAFGGPVGIVAGAATGAVAGGVLAALYKTGPQAKNVAINAQIAQVALSKIIRSFPNDSFLRALDAALIHIIGTADQFANLVTKARLPEAQQVDKNAANALGVSYQQEIGRLDGMIDAFLDNARKNMYEPRGTGDVWSKLKAPLEALIGNQVTDAIRALEKLEIVNDKALNGIIEFRTQAAQLNTQQQQPFTPITPPKQQEVVTPDMLSQFEDAMKAFNR